MNLGLVLDSRMNDDSVSKWREGSKRPQVEPDHSFGHAGKCNIQWLVVLREDIIQEKLETDQSILRTVVTGALRQLQLSTGNLPRECSGMQKCKA